MTLKKLTAKDVDSIRDILSNFMEEFVIVSLLFVYSDISDELNDAGINISKAILEFNELLRKEVDSQ